VLNKLNYNLIFKKGNVKELANMIFESFKLKCKRGRYDSKTLGNIVVKNHSVDGLMEKLVNIICNKT